MLWFRKRKNIVRHGIIDLVPLDQESLFTRDVFPGYAFLPGGKEIVYNQDGKIKRLDLVTKEATQAENLRKLLLAISKDVRVLLVKLADRLHNMRTLDHVSPDKRVRIAQETMDIYAPLAGRMGMQNVRDELEDIAFKVLNPDAYEDYIAALQKKEIANLREGLRLGYSTPKRDVELVIEQLDAILAAPVTASPFWSPAERDADPAFRKAWEDLLRDGIHPAADRYRRFLREEYLAKAREPLTVAANPDGERCYAAYMRDPDGLRVEVVSSLYK